jgi:hypothetical protein
MSLSPEQFLALQLAGTVALPSPPPATGSVEIAPSSNASGIHLRIVHRVSLKLTLIRYVSVDHVRAICAHWEVGKPAGEAEVVAAKAPVVTCWACKTLIEFRPLLEQRLKSGKSGPFPLPWLEETVVYVPEQAPVLMQVDVGLTAAESAEYYPPLGADFAHDLQCEKCRCKKTWCEECRPKKTSM